jgi:hypothetical protein
MLIDMNWKKLANVRGGISKSPVPSDFSITMWILSVIFWQTGKFRNDRGRGTLFPGTYLWHCYRWIQVIGEFSGFKRSSWNMRFLAYLCILNGSDIRWVSVLSSFLRQSGFRDLRPEIELILNPFQRNWNRILGTGKFVHQFVVFEFGSKIGWAESSLRGVWTTSWHRGIHRLCSQHTDRQTAEHGRSGGQFPREWIVPPARACVMQHDWSKNVSDSVQPIPWPGFGFNEMKYIVIRLFWTKTVISDLCGSRAKKDL